MRKVLLLIMMAVVVAGCTTSSPSSDQLLTEKFTTCSSEHRQQIQNYLSMGLFDPYSAMYGFGKEEPVVYQGKFVTSIYASVNAKNRFGAYVGQQFYQFVCLPDDQIAPVNPFKMGMINGLLR